MSMRIEIQRWGGTLDEERSWEISDEEELVTAIQTLTNEVSATLGIYVADYQWLVMSVSEGLFSVGAQLGEGVAFDLIGDLAATGAIPFSLGGQLVDHPCRYLVNLDQVLTAALEFFRTGTIDTTMGWDQQGPDDLWGKF